MDFRSVSDIAALWGISERSVRNYCAQGRIPGAFLTGKTWNIPADAEKPRRSNAAQGTKSSPLLTRLMEERSAGISGGIYHKLQIELTYNSNHIEGSRLSKDQTRLIFDTSTVGFDEGQSIKVDDIIETSNHFRCIDYCLENATKPLSETMIKKLHRILKSGTRDGDISWFSVGEYKRIPNEVAGRQTIAPDDVPSAMRELLDSYNPRNHHSLEEIVDFHVQFERIHPFQDGNGRVGRLIMLKECFANDIVPFVITDDMKAFYYRGLTEWDQEKGFLIDTCLAAQDIFKQWMEYFQIPY